MPETPTDLNSLRSAMAAMTDEMTKMSHKLDAVETKVNETKELVQAWEAAKVGGKFIKWIGGIITGCTAIWLLIKVGVSHYLPGVKQ